MDNSLPELDNFPRRMRLALVCAIALLSCVLSADAKGGFAEVNEIAAKVNDRVITKNQLHFLLAPKLRALEKRFPNKGEEYDDLVTSARIGALEELIERQAIIVQFDHLNIEVTREQINEEVRREIRDDYQGHSILLREALKASRVTMEGYRLLLRDRLLEDEIKRQIPQNE